MKRILSLVLLSFFCLSANFAQSYSLAIHYGNLPNCNKISNVDSGINTTTSVNNEGTKEIKNSCFSIGGSLNYFANPKTIFRLKFLVQRSENKIEEVITIPFNENSKTSSSQRSILIAPSVIWEMGSKPFRPRIGLELPITLLGKTNRKIESFSEKITDFGNVVHKSTTTQLSDIEIIPDTDFGLALIFGVSYRLNKFISINAELSPRIVYSNYTSIVNSKNKFMQLAENMEGTETVFTNEINFTSENRLEIEEKRLVLVPNPFEIILAFNF